MFKDCGFYIIKILNQRFYLATFARFYLSSATFNTYIQYNMELRYILLNTGKDQKNKVAWVEGHARSFWITRELRTQISGRCRLNPFNKCDVLSNNWPLIIGPKLIALRSRKFIACHSNPSVLNNASVLWCVKKSRMGVLMPRPLLVMPSFACKQLLLPYFLTHPQALNNESRLRCAISCDLLPPWSCDRISIKLQLSGKSRLIF